MLRNGPLILSWVFTIWSARSVRERVTRDGEKSKDLVLFIAESVGEVVSVALPCQAAAIATPLWWRPGRTQSKRNFDGLAVVGPDRSSNLGWHLGLFAVSCDLGRPTSCEQTLAEYCRPLFVCAYLENSSPGKPIMP